MYSVLAKSLVYFLQLVIVDADFSLSDHSGITANAASCADGFVDVNEFECVDFLMMDEV